MATVLAPTVSSRSIALAMTSRGVPLLLPTALREYGPM